METCSLQSPALTAIPTSSLSNSSLFEVKKPFFHGQVLKFPVLKKHPDAKSLKFLDLKLQASSAAKVSSEAAEGKADSKDANLAFVAGATGRVGSRTVRELLKLGFRVRAGVRSIQRAERLVQIVKQLKANDTTQPVEKLELVECDLEKPDQILSAIGNASVVICSIGASEEVFDISGPYRIDYRATKNLVDAATAAKVNHYIMVSSLGTNKIGFPAAILNLFWGVLIWKRKAEEALITSGIPYTIVRPGGMERPTDAFKETHNITLSPEDTLFGGLISNLQVAELIAVVSKNPRISAFKVVEAIAETTAPLTPMEDLLAKIPSARPDYFPKEPVSTKPEPTPSESVISEEPRTPKSAQPLSPYTVYEDLKPPSSPSPTPSGSKDAPSSASKTTASSTAEIPSQNNSPYPAYDDLKPPTSPSPSTPIVDGSALPSNSTPPVVDKPDAKQEHDIPKSRPLSPYAMYEDLKPPSSPSPSAPKI